MRGTEPTSPGGDPTLDQVRRKARRMARARRERSSVWVALAQAGTVGWQLVLPLVAGTLLGNVVARATGRSWVALLGLLIGLFLGLWGAGRVLRAGIVDEDEGASEGEGKP